MIYHGEFRDVLEMVTKATNYCFQCERNGVEGAILKSATDIYIEQMREVANLPKDESKEIKWEHLTRESLTERWQRGQIRDGSVESMIAQDLLIYKDVIRIIAGDRALYLVWDKDENRYKDLMEEYGK